MNNLSIKQMCLIFAGTVLTAAGSSLLLIPNKIVGGGVVGLSNMIYHMWGISAGISSAVINGCLLVIGYQVLGKEFTIKTICGAGMLSVFMELFDQLPPLTNDTVIATVFGSIFFGLGIGISLAAGGTTGGTDIVGRLVQHKFPQISIGKLLLIIDGVITLGAFVVFKEVELALLGSGALVLSTYTIDWVIEKLNAAKIAFVITDYGEKISKELIASSSRGITVIECRGAYTNAPKELLLCAVKKKELEHFRQKIQKIDRTSFVIFLDVNMIQGKGFHLYK